MIVRPIIQNWRVNILNGLLCFIPLLIIKERGCIEKHLIQWDAALIEHEEINNKYICV